MTPARTFTALEWCRSHRGRRIDRQAAALALATIIPLARQRAGHYAEDHAAVDLAERQARAALAEVA